MREMVTTDHIKRQDSLLPPERREHILRLIRDGVAIRVSRLSELAGVSEMTIRRDLDVLEQKGMIDRTHGGAVYRENRIVDEFRYNSQVEKNIVEKQRIAQKAASLITAQDIVFIGQGTTTPLVLRYLDPHASIRVITNNLGVINEIHENAVDLVLLGGRHNEAAHSLVGPATLEMINQVFAAKVLLGVDGLSLRAGLTTPSMEMAAIERAMIRQTRGQVILLVDHDKFGRVADYVIAALDQADVLITDREVPPEFRDDLKSMGVKVIIA